MRLSTLCRAVLEPSSHRSKTVDFHVPIEQLPVRFAILTEAGHRVLGAAGTISAAHILAAQIKTHERLIVRPAFRLVVGA